VKSRWGMFILAGILLGFTGISSLSLVSAPPASSEKFSPAHVSVAEAARHFFGIRPKVAQPIAFVHKLHIESVQLGCTDCHISVEKGPRAGIPDIRTCWSCHVDTALDRPEVMKIHAYHVRGEDIPWQRVYGWTDEAHVRFDHAPHIRASVECTTCHGDLATMGVAQRVVDHTMQFCVSCHKQKNVSTDCGTCHY